MKRRLRSLLLALLCLWMLATPVSAASQYHTPAMTILTENAPRDLEIMIRIHLRDGSVVPIILDKKTKAWEQQFRLYREAGFSVKAWYGNDYDLLNAELVLRSGGEEKVIVMPQELTDRMRINDVLVLDYKAGTLSLGDPIWRGPLMLVLRILVAVGLALLIFRLRMYSYLRSYLAVGISTLAAFGLLGWYTSGWLNFDNRAVIPYIILLVLALLIMSVVNLIVIDEDDRDRTFVTTILAFGASALSNILMLYFLPI